MHPLLVTLSLLAIDLLLWKFFIIFFYNFQAEDAVCLADYCDIMRCDVLGNRDFDSSLVDGTSPLNTDIQVWRESTEHRGSSTPCENRELSRTYRGDKSHAVSDGSSSSFISLQRLET